jgi:elongation factor Ts
MYINARHALPLRFYSTSPPEKPSLKLVAELRKLTEVSITKAREALSASNNDVVSALAWLQKDLITSGAKKAAKVQGRVAGEGLVSVSVLSGGAGLRAGLGSGSIRAAMVELNCETDFVGRNDLFGKLATDIAHTAAFISDPVGSDTLFRPCPLDALNDAPLISQADPQSRSSSTVGSAVRDMIAKVGEKISLRRAITVVRDPLPQTQPELGLRLASYVHGSINVPSQGRIGALAILALKAPGLYSLLSSDTFREDLERLERSLGRQIVGFDTRLIRSPADAKDETALYEQPFMMLAGEFSGQPVHEVLRSWARQRGFWENGSREAGGLEVLEFVKWTVGETPNITIED